MLTVRSKLLPVFAIAGLCLASGPSAKSETLGWPQWRGAAQNGVAVGDQFPQKWSETSVAWKVDLPGRGGSTPVVVGDTAYLTSGANEKNTLIAIGTADGSVRWETTIGKDRGAKHKKGGGSNPSAIFANDSIFAYFRSGDLACVGADGKVRWQTNVQDELGEDTLWWDLGTSPITTDDAVIVTVMQTGPSYLAAFDKKTGKQLWKVDRTVDAPEEAAQSYATPVNVEVNGQAAVAVMGGDYLTLHAASNGKELGRLGGFNPTNNNRFRSISSPVASGSLIICPYARGASVTAVDMNALAAGKGKDAIVWFRDDLGSDVPTPAAKDGRVYFVGDGKQARGLISGVDARTGKTIWTLQLPKSRIGFSSSPLIAGDHLYITREDATTFLVGPLSSDKPAVVATNELEDSDQFTVASPVPSGESLLIRSRHRLYQIAK